MTLGGPQPPAWFAPYFVGPVCAAAGYIFGLFLDRWSDFRKTPDRLREDLKRGVLGPSGRKRLAPFSADEVNRLCIAFPQPPLRVQAAMRKGSDKLLGVGTNSTVWTRSETGELRPTGISPILIHLESEGTPGASIANELASELSQILARKASDSGTFKEILQLYDPPLNTPPLVIIATPNLIVRSPDALTGTLRKVADVAREYFVSARVGLVFYASEDLRDVLAGRESDRAAPHNADEEIESEVRIQPASKAQEYTYFRDSFVSLLCRGWYGRQRVRPDNGMSGLVADRVNEFSPAVLRAIAAGSTSFTAIGIWGPPGSGKSSLALHVADALIAGSNAIVLDISHELFTGRLAALSSWSREHSQQALGNIAYDLMPDVPDQFGQRETAFQDAWLSVLNRLHPAVVLLVEDLYASSGTRESLNALRPVAAKLGLKFILVDRAQVKPVSADEQLVTFVSELWSRNEAIRLLRVWVSAERHALLESEMARGWLADQKRFSSYMLEIIARNLGNLQATNSEKLLRETMRPQTERISGSLAGATASPQERIEEVRQLLIRNEPRETILERLSSGPELDPVMLLGQLSWFSQFTHESPAFDVADVLRWSGGIVTLSEKTAEGVLNAGLASGVFGFDERGRFLKYIWSNPLVRDGCAALYLRQQFQHIPRATTAEMVKRLHRAGSVEILTLALDATMLLIIVASLGATSDVPEDLLDRLLSGQMMSRLAQDTGQLNQLVQALFTVVSTAEDQFETASSLCKSLVQILPFSQELSLLVDQLAAYDNPRGTLAVGILAWRLVDDAAFFEKVRDRGDTVPLEMAVRLWSVKGAAPLLDFLAILHSRGNVEPVERLWRRFCARQDAGSLNRLQAEVQDRVFGEPALETFWVVVFRCILHSAINVEVRGSLNTRIDELRQLASRAVDRGFQQIAAEVAKWVCLYINRDLTSETSEWVCYVIEKDIRKSPSDPPKTKAGTYALPRYSSEPATVPAILERTMRGGFVELPSVDDLKASGVQVGAPELTRDSLPSGFRNGNPYNGSMLTRWDGVSAPRYTDTAIFRLDRDKTAWRPKILLGKRIDSRV